MKNNVIKVNDTLYVSEESVIKGVIDNLMSKFSFKQKIDLREFENLFYNDVEYKLILKKGVVSEDEITYELVREEWEEMDYHQRKYEKTNSKVLSTSEEDAVIYETISNLLKIY